MTSLPVVSVVIPAYNVAPYIEEAVRSALAQSEGRIEVIVVDDGSTDGLAERVNAISDERLRLIRQERRGASAARNTGVEAARAPLVAFLDGDDVWRPGKLAAHVDAMERAPDVDLSFSLCAVTGEDGRTLALPHAPPKTRLSFADLLAENYIRSGSTVVARREALMDVGGFDVTLQACNDYDCWLRVAARRPDNALCIPKVLASYRRRSGQITGDWRRVEEAFGSLLAKLEALHPEGARRARPEALRNMYRYFALIAYKADQPGEALGLLWASARAAPLRFCLDARSWLLAGALALAACLGRRRLRGLERRAMALRDRWVAGTLREASPPESRLESVAGDRSRLEH